MPVQSLSDQLMLSSPPPAVHLVETAVHCKQESEATFTQVEFIDPSTGEMQIRPVLFPRGVICPEDSGSPVFVRLDGVDYLIGSIASVYSAPALYNSRIGVRANFGIYKKKISTKAPASHGT
jgi:hypothetical protein